MRSLIVSYAPGMLYLQALGCVIVASGMVFCALYFVRIAGRMEAIIERERLRSEHNEMFSRPRTKMPPQART